MLAECHGAADSLSLRIWFKFQWRHEMNLVVVPQILTWTAILALQSASASTCNKKFSVEQLRCFLGEDASFWQDQSHHILSLLTLTKDFMVKICEMLWEQLQDKLVCIAGVLLTMFLLGYLLYRCCSHAVDNGYRTLMNVQDDLGIDELFKVRLGILQGAIFMAIDVTLDNVNGIIYCWRGLKVFGPLTLAIPVVAGFCCFVYKRNSWALAPPDHTDATGKETFFLYQKRDRNGQLKPGLTSAILQMLQVEPFLTAYAAYKNPEKYEREWKVETAFNGVVEGFPSALLQMYTLFCMEHSHSLPGPFGAFINIASILFSCYSIGKALNVISLELLPQTKVEPPLGGLKTTQLKMLQSLDVFARISVLAAIGISLRPAADMTVNCQFYLPTLMLLELLVIGAMSKWYFGWRSFFAADSILFTVLEYFSVPMLVGTGVSLQKQLRMQLCTMTWRAIELAGGSILVWYNIHANPQKPHLYVASFAVASAFAFSVAVTIVILDRRLRYLGEPLLPAANSKGYGKIHWASALNNQELLRKIPYNELRHSDSEQSFAHVAAEHGQKDVLQFFQELVPETLKTANGDGWLPAHLAARNGHEGVVQFLHQVVPETLKTAAGNAGMPAHVAAQSGHEGVLRFLHIWPLKMARKACSNFFTRSFLRPWRLQMEVDIYQHTWPLKMATKACSDFFTRSFLRPWRLQTEVDIYQHTWPLKMAMKECSNLCTRSFLRPWKLQMDLECCQHMWPLTVATKECSDFFTRSFLRPWQLQMEMDIYQHIWPLTVATKECSDFFTRSFLRPWRLQSEMESCQRIWPLKMAMKAWSNFSMKWFLTLLQLHRNKMLRCACLMKMT